MKAYSYIRFSTPEQQKGDSLRRQVEASKKYCDEHGYVLADLNMQDLGLSAFHGEHTDKGALGMFLKLVQQGEISSGSVLIVENLDRLSRQQVLKALSQFTSIIQAGIKIVTLQDGMEYDKSSIDDNWAQLIISISSMARAHDESLRKSQRLKSVWQQKRKQAADGKILTARCPLWLKLSEDRKEFIVIPEVVEAIELIFKMRLQGFGPDKIAVRLNQMPNVWKPPINKRNQTGGWRKFYVNKILRSPAVIGQFQPQKRDEKGKKVADGNPVENYFPQVISMELFNAVQDVSQRNRNTNKGNGGGMTGKARNVFAHVLKCGICGGPMHYINKQFPYLRCDCSRRKLKDENGNRVCEAKGVRYDEFLKIFLADFDLNINELMADENERNTEIRNTEQTIQATNYQLTEIKRQRANIIDQIGKTDDADLRNDLQQKYTALKTELDNLSYKVKELNTRLDELSSNGKELAEDMDKAKYIYSLLNQQNDEEKAIELRLKLRNIIRRMVKVIKIYPAERKEVKGVKEVEPGIVRWTDSKYIRKIAIYFNGAKKKFTVLRLQGYSDIKE